MDHEAFKESISKDDSLKGLSLLNNKEVRSRISFYFDRCKDPSKPGCQEMKNAYYVEQLVFHPSLSVKDTGDDTIKTKVFRQRITNAPDEVTDELFSLMSESLTTKDSIFWPVEEQKEFISYHKVKSEKFVRDTKINPYVLRVEAHDDTKEHDRSFTSFLDFLG